MQTLLNSTHAFERIYTPLSKLVNKFNAVDESRGAGKQAGSDEHKKRWR